jgi:predicted HicB family RNase H-like nuclease
VERKNPRRELLLTDVPSEIRQALDEQAATQKESVNAVAVRILADRYKVKYQAPHNGLRGQRDVPTHSFRRNPDSTKLTIRGGAKLHRKISVDAARRGGTLRGVVLEALALHYQLTPEPIGRRPRQKGDT